MACNCDIFEEEINKYKTGENKIENKMQSLC